MKIRQLMEGVEPKMPGAPKGIQIMTPQQFVAKAGDLPGEEEVDEGMLDTIKQIPQKANAWLDSPIKGMKGQPKSNAVDSAMSALSNAHGVAYAEDVAESSERSDNLVSSLNSWGYYTDDSKLYINDDNGDKIIRYGSDWKHLKSGKVGNGRDELDNFLSSKQGVAEGKMAELEMDIEDSEISDSQFEKMYGMTRKEAREQFSQTDMWAFPEIRDPNRPLHEKGVAEGLDRIRSLAGLAEATKLPASSREFGGDEFQDYMKRIVGTPDVDKSGNVKIDKKGNEKYVSGKTKTDRYKMPYIHRSSVIEYLGPDGKTYSEDKIKQALGERPKKLLKQNEKMKHSNGELEQFFNVGFAALTGIALDEDTNKLIIVNTCPGAGSCKVDCFAMKGGKVQFKAAWLSDGRILTYLLNDPDGFFQQLSSEIRKEEAAGKKGGYTVTIRWHDAGDFFSPEYLDLALKMAANHPDTKFYAYTKMAGAALAKKPDNFIINWSEGAHTSQEKQVKAQDPSLDTTKNSRIVPDELFQDLLVKDAKKNLVKGEQGQWQVQPDKLPELKQRLAKQYGLSANSILSYDEYMAKRKNIPAGMKYNVIVAPGEGDISANDPNIISTLLLKH